MVVSLVGNFAAVTIPAYQDHLKGYAAQTQRTLIDGAQVGVSPYPSMNSEIPSEREKAIKADVEALFQQAQAESWGPMKVAKELEKLNRKHNP